MKDVAWFFFDGCEYQKESLENRHFECHGRKYSTQHLVDNSFVQIWLDFLAVVIDNMAKYFVAEENI